MADQVSGPPVRRLRPGRRARSPSMMAVLGLLISAMASDPALAEKPPLDSSAFDDWPSADGADLSTDGRYALYVISHQRKDATNTVVMQALQGGWKMETAISGHAQITRDGLTAVFIKPAHTLCLVMLGTSSIESIPHVSAYRLIKRQGGEWLVYQSDDIDKKLVVRDLAGRATKSFIGIVNYWFSGDGETLVLQTASTPSESGSELALQSLQWIRPSQGAPVTFWRGTEVSDLTFDATGTQVAWMSANTVGGEATKSLWYYRAGTNKARLLVDHHSSGMADNLQLEAISYQGFSQDGDRIFINLKEKNYATPPADAVKVDVWSYKDPKLQSQQLRELTPISPEAGGPHRFVAVVPIQVPRVIRLEQENEKIDFPNGKVKDAVLLMKLGAGSWDERTWSPAGTTARAYVLLSTKDGKSVPLTPKGFLSLSPSGKYILVEDEWRRNMFSYEIATGATHDLTSDLPIPLLDQDYDEDALPRPRGIQRAAWMDHDAVIIGDHYDLWRLDLTGKTPPFNVTRGFGRRHEMEFQLTNPNELIGNGQHLLLKVVSHSTKEEGFYSQTVGSHKDPQLLTRGPYSYDLVSPLSSYATVPTAAAGATYLIRRRTASEAPNYFYTTDFKTYTPLSQVYPERAYNWLSAQLHHWKTPDGRTAQGVLYLPENFDAGRKYPVILHYYERLSQEMHEYRRPESMSDNLPIPWFVSHGYLVFTPDIRYTIGHPGNSAIDTVASAARYLASFPWVDAKKMGIQGHSFGGYETNYIVTHTNMFAAAMSSSGFADLISSSGATMYSSGQPYFRGWAEFGQGRIAATLWQQPDLYIENSPIFRVNEVTTPLLMMNNMEDGIVNFSQGVEFFTALRRLGKKAWMLQYDGEVHSLFDDRAKRQHTIRVTQFFDHYLKGAPPPKWMTEGIPARLRGIDTGLELDTSGRQP